jgi:hypothetical protein
VCVVCHFLGGMLCVVELIVVGLEEEMCSHGVVKDTIM